MKLKKMKNKMKNLNKDFLTVFIIFLIIFTSLAYIITSPRPSSVFLQLYLLNEEGKAINIYPNSTPEIPVNVNVKWYIVVENYLRKPHLVVVKIKLGNKTLPAPNEQEKKPAEMPVIYEFKKIMFVEEVWKTFIVWKITEVNYKNEMMYLTLLINNTLITVDSVLAKYNFRIIIEAWTIEKGNEIFGWFNQSNEHEVAWLQVWFNVTAKQAQT